MTALALVLLAAWPADVLDLVNREREQANLRELSIYGDIRQVRLPLEYDPVLEASAQWWCDALKGSGHFAHSGTLNDAGFLVNADGRQSSNVGLPAYPGTNHTDWNPRNWFLGLDVNGSENGAQLKRASAVNIFEGWRRSGWSINPLDARGHYFNLVLPQWKRFGVARQVWGKGDSSVFAEFSQ
jgi:hypothetical protein